MAADPETQQPPAPQPATPEPAPHAAPAEAAAPAVPDTANGNASAEAQSLQTMLRAAAARAQHATTTELEIPGYDGRLHGVFRGLDDYSEVRKIVKRHEHIPDETEQELHIAADTLVAASIGTFAVMDGKRHDLGYRLGRELAAYLGHDVENDRQGVFAVLPSTMSVMALFAEVDGFIKTAKRQTADDLVGESEAAR